LAQDLTSLEMAGRATAPEPAPLLGANNPQELLRRQHAVVAMGRRAIAQPETAVLLTDAAGLIAEMLDAECFAVARTSPDGTALSVHLTVREPDRTGSRLVVEELPVAGTDSLMSYVLRVAHPVLCPELSREARFRDPLLRRHGVRSALAVPLKLQDCALGALAACSVSPERFTPQDLLFAETIAHLAATNIARSRAEKSLAEERRLAAGIFETVGAIVLVVNLEGKLLRINRTGEQVTGFSAGDFQDRPLWSVLAAPDEVELCRETFDGLRQGAPHLEYEGLLLTKHSDRRWIRWSYSSLTGEDGIIRAIIATGIDVTEKREAEERARRAEQAAEQARRAPAAPPEDAPPSQEFPAAGEPLLLSGGKPVTLPGPINRERRHRQRRTYQCRQAVAAIVDGRLPAHTDFCDVECHDISPGGFAYVSQRPPASDQVVVALGSPPQLTYMIAQIVHITRTMQDGKVRYLVGCSYTGRAPY